MPCEPGGGTRLRARGAAVLIPCASSSRLLLRDGLSAPRRSSERRTAQLAVNAAMESWHALLRKNVLDRHRWRTRDVLHAAIVFWVEHTHDPDDAARTRQADPSEYEVASTDQDAAIAA